MPVTATLDTIHADNVALLAALSNLTTQVQLLNLLLTNSAAQAHLDHVEANRATRLTL